MFFFISVPSVILFSKLHFILAWSLCGIAWITHSHELPLLFKIQQIKNWYEKKNYSQNRLLLLCFCMCLLLQWCELLVMSVLFINLAFACENDIYAFSRHFNPKRFTIAFRLYVFVSMCVPWERNPQPFALLTQCSTTEPQEHPIDWHEEVIVTKTVGCWKQLTAVAACFRRFLFLKKSTGFLHFCSAWLLTEDILE